jgi:hypothetical protein
MRASRLPPGAAGGPHLDFEARETMNPNPRFFVLCNFTDSQVSESRPGPPSSVFRRGLRE